MRLVWLIGCVALLSSCSDAADAGADGSDAGSGGTKASGGAGAKTGGASHGGGGASQKAGSSSGGSSSGGSANGGSASGSADGYGDARVRCVERTNQLRASIGLSPIPRLASAEPCVDGQAESDSESGKAHGAFDACLDEVKSWKGAAQNECPGYGSVESALGACLDMMWAEGPGGGHYDNMVGSSTHTACGFYTTPQGKVWMIQDFWTE